MTSASDVESSHSSRCSPISQTWSCFVFHLSHSSSARSICGSGVTIGAPVSSSSSNSFSLNLLVPDHAHQAEGSSSAVSDSSQLGADSAQSGLSMIQEESVRRSRGSSRFELGIQP